MTDIVNIEDARREWREAAEAEWRASHGTWGDWSQDEVLYLLRQLSTYCMEADDHAGTIPALAGVECAIRSLQMEHEIEHLVRGVLSDIQFVFAFFVVGYSEELAVDTLAHAQGILSLADAAVAAE